jgi:hypothetical protein
MEALAGKDENVTAAQGELSHWARCNSAAALGTFRLEMEEASAAHEAPKHQEAWRDD